MGANKKLYGYYPTSSEFLPIKVDANGKITISNIPAHKTSHETGGSDKINVTGLSGLLADGQTPAVTWADWTPTLNLGPAVLSGYTVARYCIVGKIVFVLFLATTKNMGGSAGWAEISLPLGGVQGTISESIKIYDGATHVNSACDIQPNGTYFRIYKTAANGNWNGTEVGVQIALNTCYEIA